MEEQVVVIHGEPWKLADIREDVAWCKEQVWSLTTYGKPVDHDHCSICWWSLAVSEDPDVGEGYFTEGNRWLCRECHGLFVATA